MLPPVPEILGALRRTVAEVLLPELRSTYARVQAREMLSILEWLAERVEERGDILAAGWEAMRAALEPLAGALAAAAAGGEAATPNRSATSPMGTARELADLAARAQAAAVVRPVGTEALRAAWEEAAAVAAETIRTVGLPADPDADGLGAVRAAARRLVRAVAAAEQGLGAPAASFRSLTLRDREERERESGEHRQQR